MSNARLGFKTLRAVGLISISLVLSSACSLLKTETKEAAIMEGTLVRFMKVDSEYGLLNGIFSEEIIYEAYLHAPYRDQDNFALWITRDTKVYEQHDESTLIPFAKLKGGEKVRAHIGEADGRGSRTGAYAIKLIIFE